MTDLAMPEFLDRKRWTPEQWAKAEKAWNLTHLIKPGALVTIVNRFGQKRVGRAVMRGPAGWVLNMGGAHGTPAIATDENVIKVKLGMHDAFERQAKIINGGN